MKTSEGYTVQEMLLIKIIYKLLYLRITYMKF